MNNCKGYVFLELLSAFSICLLVIFTILPIVTDTITERKDILQKADAYAYLYDRLADKVNGNEQRPQDSLGHRYTITWTDASGYPGMLEGCVTFENRKGKTENICDLAKE